MFTLVRLEESQSYKLTGRDFHYVLGPLNSASKNFAFGIADFRPGEEMPAHTHDAQEEIVYVLRGEGEFVTPQGNGPMTPGVGIFIPPGLPHRIVVHGNQVLTTVSVFSPPVVPGAYDSKK